MKVSSGLSSSCYSPSTCGNKCWLCSQMSLCHEWGPPERGREGEKRSKWGKKTGEERYRIIFLLSHPSLPPSLESVRGSREIDLHPPK